MVSLLLSRAIAGLLPDRNDVIRIGMFTNMRPALGAPAAHQSLVGTVLLEYKERIRNWPVSRQATAYRGMVFAQTMDEKVWEEAASIKELTQSMIAAGSDKIRMELAEAFADGCKGMYSASISYTGRADFKEAEAFIRDFRTWTCTVGSPVLIEISAVNGHFTFDVIQMFSDPVIVNALLAEFEKNGINYELQDVKELTLPNVRLPWSR